MIPGSPNDAGWMGPILRTECGECRRGLGPSPLLCPLRFFAAIPSSRGFKQDGHKKTQRTQEKILKEVVDAIAEGQLM